MSDIPLFCIFSIIFQFTIKLHDTSDATAQKDITPITQTNKHKIDCNNDRILPMRKETSPNLN